MEDQLPLLTAKIYTFFLLAQSLSHIAQPHVWFRFYQWLLEKKEHSMLLGVTTLPWTLVLVTFHNLWELTPTLIITIFAWIGLGKAVACMLYPEWLHYVLPHNEGSTHALIRWAGIIGLLIGLFLFYATHTQVPALYAEMHWT